MLDSYKAIKSGAESTRASLVAQRLKRLPAMRETWIRSLGWEDPLKKETATHSSIHSSHGWRSLVGYSPQSCKESDTTERLHSLKVHIKR